MSAADEVESVGCKLRAVFVALIPALLATIAFVCSFLFSFWCESIKFQAKEPLIPTVQRDDLHFGPWYQLQVTVDEIDVGPEYAQFTTKSECIDWQFDPDIDSKWKAVRAFTIINGILGGFLTLPLWFIPGLTFLIFQSNACNANAAIQNFEARFNSYFFEDKCSWDAGSTANVISVLLWFLTGVRMLIVGPPHMPELAPVETQEVTYQQTTSEDGTKIVHETKVVKGSPIPMQVRETYNTDPEKQ
ncbi:hypothetical protein ACA910_007087 [Epithemia clementina (nom. ined.)]